MSKWVLKHVPIEQVIPSFGVYTKGEYFIELAESVRKYGIINPITINDQYAIVDGNQRYAAAKAAGLNKIPVVIV